MRGFIFTVDYSDPHAKIYAMTPRFRSQLIFPAIVLCTSLGAQNIDALITTALQHHPSVKAIEKRLEATERQWQTTRNFADPELSLGVNDIQFDDPLARDLEPMQFTSVNVKQRFPWFGKRDAAGATVKARQSALFASLESAQVALARRIRIAVYTRDEIDARLNLQDDYLKLTDQNVALNTAYAATKGGTHMGIMSAQLLRSQIEIKREKLLAMRTVQASRLTYLVGEQIGNVECNRSVSPPPKLEAYLARLEQNRDYRIRLAAVQGAQAETQVRDLAGNADPYLMVGYYYREAYPDYLSFTVGAALPIYGTQTRSTEAARLETLAAQATLTDFRATLRRDIEAVYAELRRAYRTYGILTEQSLPRIGHMVDLGDAKLRGGSELFAYFDLLERKLRYDEERIGARADYLRARARLKALTGVIQ